MSCECFHSTLGDEIIRRFVVAVCLLSVTSFGGVSFGFNLNCVFTNQSWSSHKTCVVENIFIVDSSQTVTSINGHTQVDHDDVKALLIESQTVKYFPRGVENFFPNLEDISIYFSKLQSIKKADLEPFKNLQALRLFNNDLEELDGDLFEFNRELRIIDFDHNKLTSVGSELLTELKKLEQAHFRHNACIHKGAKSSSQVLRLMADLIRHCDFTKEMKILRLQSKVEALQNQMVKLRFKEHENLKAHLKTLEAWLLILFSLFVGELSGFFLMLYYDLNYVKYILWPLNTSNL